MTQTLKQREPQELPLEPMDGEEWPELPDDAWVPEEDTQHYPELDPTDDAEPASAR